MARLHSLGLVVLLSASSVRTVDWPMLPEWASWNKVSTYFTPQAVQNGWHNAGEFTQNKSQAFYEAIKAHPYIAAGIAAGTISLGGLLYKVKQKYDAYKKRQQEANDLVVALLLEQVLQDEEYARRLDEQVNTEGGNVASPQDVRIQIASDEDFARQLQEQMDNFFADDQDARLAELLFREEEATFRAHQTQIEQDEAFARELQAQG